jgi:hypothetical protein
VVNAQGGAQSKMMRYVLAFIGTGMMGSISTRAMFKPPILTPLVFHSQDEALQVAEAIQSFTRKDVTVCEVDDEWISQQLSPG